MDKQDFHIYKKPNLKSKLLDKPKIDLFFHTGAVSSDDVKHINISSVLIVSTQTTKNIITNNDKIKINPQNIYIIYPSVDIPKLDKSSKKQFLKKRNLGKKTTVLYFTANNFQQTGVQIYLKIIKNITAGNFIAVISGNPTQLKPVVQLLAQMGLSKKVLLVAENMFDISDIFVLPTTNKLFAYNCLVAMAYKNVVFAPRTNTIAEHLDSFSVMDSSSDETIVHRINMLIENKEELKTYQKTNRNIAKRWTITNQYKQLKKIIKSYL